MPTDDVLVQNFGVRNEVAKRVLRLLIGGNSFVEKLEVLQATATVHGPGSGNLWLFHMPVLASFKTMTYSVILAFDKSNGEWKHCPHSLCSCPAGSNCCSHQIQMLGVLRMMQLLNRKLRDDIEEGDANCQWKCDVAASPSLEQLIHQRRYSSRVLQRHRSRTPVRGVPHQNPAILSEPIATVR